MAKYENEPGFGDVIIVSDTEIVVALKDAHEHTYKSDGVLIRIVPVRYSLADFDAMAMEFAKSNPGVHHVSYDFVNTALTVEMVATAEVARSGLPADVAVDIVESNFSLDAAEGGMLQNPGGCTTGFRMKSGSPPVWRLTSANHSGCGTGWGSVNGVAMTYQGGVCGIDTSFASGTPLTTTIQGQPWTGVQGNPASGAQVYKYGVATGWTYGYRGTAGTSTISCAVPIYNYAGGTINSAGGDSGGPYVALVWNGAGYSYSARGTHRGTSGSNKIAVRMSSINATGWVVG